MDALARWIEEDWDFRAPVIVTNEQFDQLVAMIEKTDLRRRFDVKVPDDPGTNLAFA